MRFGLAIRAFWKAMSDREAAERVALALDGGSDVPAITHTQADLPATEPEKVEPPPAQNPAITLLATLQRDARLIDLIHEDLDQYQDAQVGAAARPCLKQCRQSLDRMLRVEKLVDANENENVPVGGDASPARYRWVGEASGNPSGLAKLVHPGWQATTMALPQWSGDVDDASIIAPAQVKTS